VAVPDGTAIVSGVSGALVGGCLTHVLVKHREGRRRYLDQLEKLETTLHAVNAMLNEGAWDTDKDIAQDNVWRAQKQWHATYTKTKFGSIKYKTRTCANGLRM